MGRDLVIRRDSLESTRSEELSTEALERDFRENLFRMQGRFPEVATPNDNYMALAYTVRDRLLRRWIRTAKTYYRQASRTVCYLSAEFLLGPQLGNNLLSLGITGAAREAMARIGFDLDELLDQESEPGLGNGGLGRLAACYMDSLASLKLPAIGYGIRYEFGIFEQGIRNGWQVEVTDQWLRLGNPWEIPRPEIAFEVKLGGRTEAWRDAAGRYRVRWIPERQVQGVAHDTAILGYRVDSANLLRLWRAESPQSFDFRAFNIGDYHGAVGDKVRAETLTKVLYPNDEHEVGRRLRLEQQYFFVSCSIQDMVRIHLQSAPDVSNFHHKFAVHLNDTHPALAILELQRILLDEHGMDWDTAWELVRHTFAYTNHTLLPEALEKWPVDLFAAVLPRHLELLYEVNRRFLDGVRRTHPGNEGLLSRVSLVEEGPRRAVRMAHLACVGSFAINGVARLHSQLLAREVLQDFHALSPEKFHNVTNGVTPRRFVRLANPGLSRLIDASIGEGWLQEPGKLLELVRFADNRDFQQKFREIKRANKLTLARWTESFLGASIDPDSLFDVQVKRIHEYKRQHLNALHIIHLARRLLDSPGMDVPPRTFLIAGKAAPGYRMAKLMIRLVTSIGEWVAREVRLRDRLRVVFLPNFGVKLGTLVYPAADLSEQISTAGKEASGTGNMKLAMNGAITIGTLDGANIEIREQVGPENFFLFGRSVEEIEELQRNGYQPWRYHESDPELRAVLELIASGILTPDQPDLFQPLLQDLLSRDPYFLLADFRPYVDCQARAGAMYTDATSWTRRAILNVACTGYFSSDRAIREYAEKIWHVDPVTVCPE